MIIGILSAMPEEIDLLSSNIEDAEVLTFGGREYITGKLEGQEVVAVFSRWGKVAAAQTATTLITKFGAKKIIFTGVAGAAAPDLRIGDVVIGEELLQHDMDASLIPAFVRFEIPLLGITHFKSDRELTLLAFNAAQEYLSAIRSSSLSSELQSTTLDDHGIGIPTARFGIIASGDQFIGDSAKITELREAINGLLCIEMEGAAVAQVCHEHQIPFAVIRAISDKADSNAVHDFPGFVKNIVSHYSNGIVRSMLKNL
ncbi:MAG: 5'-methylthioadenosine/adenosylhomocysteine nucleosidase [Bacteroidota bacterium]|nr:5'-methylthioadenosine/adenosylhomocysteine nucleosidase [Bacteroidota bacterium]MDP4230037.1 5'-methylthioadenosine/adenosylhomocysteine nucleosidase [Bacteroidota bacterium]MDP4234846.1 5'-methylthioadenosine/adenosylhomocysteine nucleosidase [Bacteroidota bacterium]